MKLTRLIALAAAAALYLAAPAMAQPLGAPNSTATLMGTQNSDHVSITGGTISGVTITAPISTTVVKTSAAVTANATTTYANVTGLTYTVVPGTYKFTLMLPSTVASGTGGIKYAFNYTGTVLSALESTSQGFTASAVAVQHTTTPTTQTDLFTQAAVVIFVQIEGTMAVTTGGTIDVQVAQNTSNASNTVALIGGSLQMVRIS